MNALRKDFRIAERDWHSECTNRPRPALRVVPKPAPETISFSKLAGFALMWAIAIGGVICMCHGVGYAF